MTQQQDPLILAFQNRLSQAQVDCLIQFRQDAMETTFNLPFSSAEPHEFAISKARLQGQVDIVNTLLDAHSYQTIQE